MLRLLAILLVVMPVAAMAQADPAEAQIRAVIARWYAELAKKDEGRPWNLVAPGFIDASPYYDHVDTGSRALGPRIYTSLPARALKFAYDIERVRIDPNFARVHVWERGYFYAWAAETSYETAASTTFVLERGADGQWRILAHQSSSQGIPPGKHTVPMPDMRPLHEKSKR